MSIFVCVCVCVCELFKTVFIKGLLSSLLNVLILRPRLLGASSSRLATRQRKDRTVMPSQPQTLPK